jgi:hypothetical protein
VSATVAQSRHNEFDQETPPSSSQLLLFSYCLYIIIFAFETFHALYGDATTGLLFPVVKWNFLSNFIRAF